MEQPGQDERSQCGTGDGTEGSQGNLEEPPQQLTLEVWRLYPRLRSARLPYHLTVVKESAVASDRKTPEASDESELAGASD